MPDAARLAQLVRILGTDRDGERLAAVAAIDRALKDAGHDWHTLADAVERGWQITGAKTRTRLAECMADRLLATCLMRGGDRLSASESDFLQVHDDASDRAHRAAAALA